MLSQRHELRLNFMLLASCIIIFGLSLRMVYLQIYQGEYYKGRAEGNRTRISKIVSPRGIIYDDSGEALVRNEPGFVVSLRHRNRPYNKGVITKLSNIIEVPEEKIYAKIKRQNGSYEPVRLKSNLSPELVTKIEESLSDLPDVMLELLPLRVYMDKELGVHFLGYVGEVSDYDLKRGIYKDLEPGAIAGKFGLEAFYDEPLRGIDGKTVEEVDVSGQVIKELNRVEPIPGEDLILTINANLQREAEKAVDEQLKWLRDTRWGPKANAASVVVMDPRTGAIKAMVSRPAFDPNLFVTGISSKNWKKINENPYHPLLNKAIAGEYPPGSTFKIVTGSAALETKKVTPYEKIFDSGKHWLIPMGNAGGEALGWINFHTALAKSDNVYFYEMGNRVGIDSIDKYANIYGIGTKTGIDLFGEASGMIPSPKYKKQLYNEDWYLGDTFNAAIGQGFTLATPLQIASMMGAVAMDGVRYKPYLVDKFLNPDGSVAKVVAPVELPKLDVSQSTLKIIQSALKAVAQEGGTASSLANLPVKVAGKTGTAENSHGKDHGLFIAYAPADNPTIVVAVVVEQGNFGSLSAAPIVQKILKYEFSGKKYQIKQDQKNLEFFKKKENLKNKD